MIWILGILLTGSVAMNVVFFAALRSAAGSADDLAAQLIEVQLERAEMILGPEKFREYLSNPERFLLSHHPDEFPGAAAE